GGAGCSALLAPFQYGAASAASAGSGALSVSSYLPAALLTVAPTPTTGRHSGSRALMRHSPFSSFSRYRATGLPRALFGQSWTVPTNSNFCVITILPGSLYHWL